MLVMDGCVCVCMYVLSFYLDSVSFSKPLALSLPALADGGGPCDCGRTFRGGREQSHPVCGQTEAGCAVLPGPPHTAWTVSSLTCWHTWGAFSRAQCCGTFRQKRYVILNKHASLTCRIRTQVGSNQDISIINVPQRCALLAAALAHPGSVPVLYHQTILLCHYLFEMHLGIFN